jgi:hypothetical protein
MESQPWQDFPAGRPELPARMTGEAAGMNAKACESETGEGTRKHENAKVRKPGKESRMNGNKAGAAEV